MLEIDRIERGRDRQPRKAFDDDSLTELSRSIAAQGILQPLVVRPNPQKAAYYLIVAGERRFRAAQLLLSGEDEGERSQVARLPCLIREMTESQAFAQALVENLQREDLSRLDLMMPSSVCATNTAGPSARSPDRPVVMPVTSRSCCVSLMTQKWHRS